MRGFLRRLVRRAQPWVPQAGSGVYVLAYHLVEAGTDSPVDLPEAIFCRQMEALATGGRVIGLDPVLPFLQDPSPEALTGSSDPLSPQVVLTFDDAYDNFRTRVWPVLERLGLPATLYVPTGFLEGRCSGPLAGARDHRPMAWSDLADLTTTGLVTVGSHSDTHPDLPRLSDGRVREELRRAQDLLEQHLQCPIPHFCYPGARWSRRVERQVGERHRSAAIAGGVLNRVGRTRPLRLTRLPVRRDMPEDLEPVLSRAVWLEEWLASRVRAWR